MVTNIGGDFSASGPEKLANITAGGLTTLSGLTTGNVVVINSGTTNNKAFLTINGAVQSQNSFVATAPATTLNAVLTGRDATFNSRRTFISQGSAH